MTELTCTSCSRQRRNLKGRRSSVVKGQQIILCTECSEKGYEPRFLLIMAARQHGVDKIADFLLKDRYHQGDKGPILAKELLQ